MKQFCLLCVTLFALISGKGFGQTISIPDPNFKAFLVSNYDTSGDGEIQITEAHVVTGTMDTPGAYGSPGNISDLTGIEHFTGITGLDCSYEQLTFLDVSHNTNLQILHCYSNQLTALNVSANTNLQNLQCSNNQLTSLNVGTNTNLEEIACWSNQLVALDVSGVPNLINLYCSRNKLSNLNLNVNSSLDVLYCDHNQLTTFDVHLNANLRICVCDDNQLTSLIIGPNPTLSTLHCAHNQLADIPDVTSLSNINDYVCNYNYFGNDDCPIVVAIAAMDLGHFVYNPQADLSTLPCTVPVTWRKNFGSILDDYSYSIQQTSDGGYIVAGYSNGFTYGNADFLIYKLDANGNKVWRKNFGSSNVDKAYSIQQTSDGGYIVAGESYGFTYGSSDFLIYKLDGNGNKVWRKNFGSSALDRAQCIQQISDGGYIVAGYSYGFSYGGYDFLIYKLDANGDKVWRSNFGSTDYDHAYCIQQTEDGGYVVAGDSSGFTHGGKDFLIYKLDANGNKVWRRNYGSYLDDVAYSIQQTSDGNYIVAGNSNGFTYGASDFLVYKLDSNGNKVWRKNFGSYINDGAYCIRQTNDGGYVVAGNSEGFTYGTYDFLFYKLDTDGNKVWRKHYGSANYDYARSIQQTEDGGYVVAGYSDGFSYGEHDFLIYKLDENGNK